MTPWQLLEGNPLHDGGYSMVALRSCDREPIRHWRNAQLEVLRQRRPLTSADQERYFREVIGPLANQELPDQLLVSYLEGEKALGYGGLTHIDWEAKRAEVSFLLDPVLTVDLVVYEAHFSRFLRMLAKLSFEILGLHRLFTETFAHRTRHIEILEKAGFQLEGRLRDHVWLNGSYCDSLIHGVLEGGRMPFRH